MSSKCLWPCFVSRSFFKKSINQEMAVSEVRKSWDVMDMNSDSVDGFFPVVIMIVCRIPMGTLYRVPYLEVDVKQDR